MADKKPKSEAVKRKPTAPAKPAVVPAKKPKHKPRNYNLGNGVYRFSRSRMYHKKALYKFVGKKTTKAVSKATCFHVHEYEHTQNSWL